MAKGRDKGPGRLRGRGPAGGSVGPAPEEGERRRRPRPRALRRGRRAGATERGSHGNGTELQTPPRRRRKRPPTAGRRAPARRLGAELRAHPTPAQALREQNLQEEPPARPPRRGWAWATRSLRRAEAQENDLEAECSHCTRSKCKCPEVGTEFRCWRQSEEGCVLSWRRGMVAGGAEQPEGLGFVLKEIGSSRKLWSTLGAGFQGGCPGKRPRWTGTLGLVKGPRSGVVSKEVKGQGWIPDLRPLGSLGPTHMWLSAGTAALGWVSASRDHKDPHTSPWRVRQCLGGEGGEAGSACEVWGLSGGGAFPPPHSLPFSP